MRGALRLKGALIFTHTYTPKRTNGSGKGNTLTEVRHWKFENGKGLQEERGSTEKQNTICTK